MKNYVSLAAMLFIAIMFTACKKQDIVSEPVTAASTDDSYIEKLPPVQTPVTQNVDANIGGYLEALPSQYSKRPNKHYPVIFFLHGSGETGSGSASDLNKVTDNAIPHLIAIKTFPANFTVKNITYQFIVISPQFKGWPQPSDINDMISYAIKKYRIDTTRMYVSGLSMGGGGAWDYAWNYPKRIAAVVPISGASWPTTEKALPIAQANLPVWAFHNNDDGTVPSWYSVDYVQYINDDKPKVKAKLTLWPTGGHDAWTKATDPTYTENGQNIYEWMLSYKRKPS